MEKPNYREELEQINEFFGGKRDLTISDVARYTGLDRHTAKAKYGIDPKRGITVVALAKARS